MLNQFEKTVDSKTDFDFAAMKKSVALKTAPG